MARGKQLVSTLTRKAPKGDTDYLTIYLAIYTIDYLTIYLIIYTIDYLTIYTTDYITD
jgi:hypothetical protein